MSVVMTLLKRDLAALMPGSSRGNSLLPLLFFLAVAMLFPFAVGPDAELLLLVWRSARRGPLPPGASRDDLTRTFPGWTIVQECDYDADLPFPLRRIDPRWYLLGRM